jgi:hypothetical protein
LLYPKKQKTKKKCIVGWSVHGGGTFNKILGFQYFVNKILGFQYFVLQKKMVDDSNNHLPDPLFFNPYSASVHIQCHHVYNNIGVIKESPHHATQLKDSCTGVYM